MEKLIKILSIISVILAGIGLLLAVAILTFLWEPVNILINTHETIIEEGAFLPVGNMLYMAGCLLVSAILIATHKTKKFFIAEVLSVVLLGIALPIVTYCLGVAQSIYIGRYIGYNAVAALGTSSSLMVIPLGFVKLSRHLCMITCGMRMAVKIVSKYRVAINILSISSTAFSVCSCLLAASMLTFFWKPMASFYSMSLNVINEGAIFPIGSMVSILGCTAIAAILLATSKSRKIIVMEIISLNFLCILLPFLNYILTTFQRVLISGMGADAVNRFAITNNLMAIPAELMSWSLALCLVLCGMRIAYKCFLLKLDAK